MKLSDLKGLFNTSEITVESIKNPYGDYYVIDLKPGNINTWSPGEHAIFTIPSRRITGKKRRTFSLASAPEEGFIRIGTRVGEHISSFKEQLISLKKGDKINMRGPFGWFKIKDQTTPMVLIAGGVGITPIRSMLAQVLKESNRDVILLYASKTFHLFKDDIVNFQKQNNKIQFLELTNEVDMFSAINKEVDKFGNDAYYYISGSKDFVASISKDLKVKQIKSKQIVKDQFLGY